MASPLISRKKNPIHETISYYLEKEPESCLVAEYNGKVVGYLLGCIDDRNNPESILIFILEALARYPKMLFMDKKDRRFWKGQNNVMWNAAFGKSEEARLKHLSNAGHIHINLLPKARGKGVGTRLLKAFFKYAKSKGIKTIHADSFQTRLNPNGRFWQKNGFKEYSKVKTTFWKQYYPKEAMHLVCYYRKI